MSHPAQLQMVVEWASLQLQTGHFAELIAFVVKLTSATVKNHNQRAIKNIHRLSYTAARWCVILAPN